MPGSYVSWRMVHILKRNWQVSSKLTWGIWRILTRTLKNLKNLHFYGLLLNKVYVWTKKSIGEFCLMALNIDATFEGKLTFVFKNDMRNLANFHWSSCSKVQNLGFWWYPFIQSKKCISLKFTGEICVKTLKNDAKFEEELTSQFKIDIRNLTNFDLSTWKSQKFTLLWSSFEQSI